MHGARQGLNGPALSDGPQLGKGGAIIQDQRRIKNKKKQQHDSRGSSIDGIDITVVQQEMKHQFPDSEKNGRKKSATECNFPIGTRIRQEPEYNGKPYRYD